MLILLRQLRTGENPITGIDIFEQKHFNTATTSIVTTTVEDGQLDEYEMATGQLVFDTGGGSQYVYNGAGGVTAQDTPDGPTYELTLIRVDGDGDTVTDSLGFFEAGESVAVTTDLPAGFDFDRWTRFGLLVSTEQSFSYTMPAANTILQARFVEEEAEPEPTPIPDPEPIADTFYDLELRIKGIQIPMPPFVQKAIEGLLSDIFEGEYSYPVNIPLSPKEMAALGLPNDPQTKITFIDSIYAEMWSHGNLRYRGHIDVMKSDDDRIRTTFVLDSGFFISQNKELKIPQCYGDDDVIDISGKTTYAVSGYHIQVAYHDYRVTINSLSRNFLKAEYADETEILEGIANWLESLALGLQIKIEYGAYTEQLNSISEQANYLVYYDTDQITTCTVTRIVPSNSGANEYFSDPFLNFRKLTSLRKDMSDFSAVDPANRVAFPSVYNRGLYEGNNPVFEGVVNRFDIEGRLYSSNTNYPIFGQSLRWENTIIPFIYLVDVVKQIFRKLKIEVYGDFFDHDLVTRMLLYNNATLDKLKITWFGVEQERTPPNILAGAENPFGSWRYENTLQTTIKLANHVPDYSVMAFLKGLKNFFGLKYNFNILQNRVEIRFVRSIIRSRTVLDLTRQAGRVFTLHHGKDSGYAFTYENPDPIMQDGSVTARNEAVSTDENGAISFEEDYTVQNYLALESLDAELFEIAYVESLRAWFQLVPDQANPPFWKLYAFRQQSDKGFDSAQPDTGGVSPRAESRGRRPWSLTLFPLVDSFISGKKMPAIECTANNQEVKLENKECGLRIFAFYGVQESADGHPYPFASCTRYDAQELLSEEQYDLDIRSEDIYPLHADQERIITEGKEYETTLILDNYDLLQLSRSPIIRIANLDYILEEKEIQNTSKEYAIAKVRLFKIK